MNGNRKLRKHDTTSMVKDLELEEIIGLTTNNANGLASNINTSCCVYPAGCVAVVYNVESGKQSHLIVSNRAPKPLSCVAVSPDGRFIGAGESVHQPAVLVWDRAAQSYVAELKGHQYGVACISFSPDGKHLVSVGFPHDGYICLWDWNRGILVKKLKACSPQSTISSVSFSANGKFIVSAGKKYLKFWTVRYSTGRHSKNEAASLITYGKPVKIGSKRGGSFISITPLMTNDDNLTCSKQIGEPFPIYALTDTGVLYVAQSSLLVGQEVDLMVEKGFSAAASTNLIACGCNDGIVKLIDAETLAHMGSLYYSEAINCNADMPKIDCLAEATHPDALACQFLTPQKLVVVYGDNSLYIWDISDVSKATRCCALVSHNACIMDIATLPCENMHDPSLACAARGCFGGVSFATCSANGIIRLWDLALQPVQIDDAKNELGPSSCLVSAGIFEREIVESGVGTHGFRSMEVSSDGKYLASGDCRGNLHIYDLHAGDYTCLQDAHDAEILCLSFSSPNENDMVSQEPARNHYLLASGGRDRIIHIFDVNRNFNLIASIDDHSAAVTSVKLSSNGHNILSCSADRSLVLRDIAIADNSCQILLRHHQMASSGTVYDMIIDSDMEVAVTVGQDKNINVFNIATGKLLKSFKHGGDIGEPIKVTMDQSSTFLICSYTNKSICMYDFTSGAMVARATGHGEVITGAIFLPDCKRIISVGGDGCIFVWKLPARLASHMQQKMKKSSGHLSPESASQPVTLTQIKFQGDNHGWFNHSGDVLENAIQAGHQMPNQGSPQIRSTFKFSISRLPKWAQSKVKNSHTVSTDPSSSSEIDLKELFCTASDDYHTAFSDSQGPCQHDSGGCEPSFEKSPRLSSGFEDSPSSACTKDTDNFAFEKHRWLTIHTVCLDLLSSTEVQGLPEIKTPAAAKRLWKYPISIACENEHKISSGNCTSENHISMQPVVQYSNCGCNDGRVLTANGHSSTSYEDSDQEVFHDERVAQGVACEELEDQFTEGNDCMNQTTIAGQDEDLFSQHFGNLSATFKLERKRSSRKRSYSARFVVRRDHNRSACKISEASSQSAEVIHHKSEENDSHQLTSEVPLQISTDCKNSGYWNQDQGALEHSPQRPRSNHSYVGSIKDSASSHSNNTEQLKEKGFISGQSLVVNSILGCKEALVNLDVASTVALQSLLEFAALTSREGQPGADLYDEAAELLPLITGRLAALTKLVHSSTKGPGRTTEKVEVTEFIMKS